MENLLVRCAIAIQVMYISRIGAPSLQHTAVAADVCNYHLLAVPPIARLKQLCYGGRLSSFKHPGELAVSVISTVQQVQRQTAYGESHRF